MKIITIFYALPTWRESLLAQNHVKILIFATIRHSKEQHRSNLYSVNECCVFDTQVAGSTVERQRPFLLLVPFKYQPTTFSLGYFVFNSFMSPTFYFPFLRVILPPPSALIWARESWMIYRGPSFLAAVIWFGSYATTSHLSKFGRRQTGRLRKRNKLLNGEGGKKWGRSGENAWSSINHSTLSDLGCADNRTGKEKRCIVLASTLQWDSLRRLDDCRNRRGGRGWRRELMQCQTY